MEKNSTEPRLMWMTRPQLGAVLKIHQQCFNCALDLNIFMKEEETTLSKVFACYEDKTAYEQALRKMEELLTSSKKTCEEIRKISDEYSELILKAKLVILGFVIIKFDTLKRRTTIIRIGVVQEDAANIGKMLVNSLVKNAKENKRELAMVPDAIPESMRFLFPPEKLTPTEPEGTFLLAL